MQRKICLVVGKFVLALAILLLGGHVLAFNETVSVSPAFPSIDSKIKILFAGEFLGNPVFIEDLILAQNGHDISVTLSLSASSYPPPGTYSGSVDLELLQAGHYDVRLFTRVPVSAGFGPPVLAAATVFDVVGARVPTTSTAALVSLAVGLLALALWVLRHRAKGSASASASSGSSGL